MLDASITTFMAHQHQLDFRKRLADYFGVVLEDVAITSVTAGSLLVNATVAAVNVAAATAAQAKVKAASATELTTALGVTIVSRPSVTVGAKSTPTLSLFRDPGSESPPIDSGAALGRGDGSKASGPDLWVILTAVVGGGAVLLIASLGGRLFLRHKKQIKVAAVRRQEAAFSGAGAEAVSSTTAARSVAQPRGASNVASQWDRRPPPPPPPPVDVDASLDPDEPAAGASSRHAVTQSDERSQLPIAARPSGARQHQERREQQSSSAQRMAAVEAEEIMLTVGADRHIGREAEDGVVETTYASDADTMRPPSWPPRMQERSTEQTTELAAEAALNAPAAGLDAVLSTQVLAPTGSESATPSASATPRDGAQSSWRQRGADLSSVGARVVPAVSSPPSTPSPPQKGVDLGSVAKALLLASATHQRIQAQLSRDLASARDELRGAQEAEAKARQRCSEMLAARSATPSVRQSLGGEPMSPPLSSTSAGEPKALKGRATRAMSAIHAAAGEVEPDKR